MIKHLTATAYIIAEISGKPKVLLHHHKKLGLWIGIGGHVEKGENPKEALFREVKEETGLSIEIMIAPRRNPIQTPVVNELRLPEAILEENIPRFGKTPAHIHLDCIYFATASNIGRLRMKEDFLWAEMSDLGKLPLPKEVQILAKRALVIYRTKFLR
ncbi:NUDIX domain-containing protein [Candidatus Gottesmanbacteria bacterium]|nr:NUDIX domain-containing protein [Candidatus Gottesmanbacteria bacterium]